MAHIRCDETFDTSRFCRKSIKALAILPLQTRTVRLMINTSDVPLIAPNLPYISVLKTKPNAAHYTLARFAIPSIRQKLAPGSVLTHITQNIDGLSPSSLDEVRKAHPGCEETLEDGTNLGNIIEMHGHLFDVVCTAHDCDYRETNRNSPICPALAGTEAELEEGAPEPVVRRADLPRCPRPDCGQLCRPGVVWFGERPYRIHEVLALADEADMCIVVGTSAIVSNFFFLTALPSDLCLHSLLTPNCRSSPLRGLQDV